MNRPDIAVWRFGWDSLSKDQAKVRADTRAVGEMRER